MRYNINRNKVGDEKERKSELEKYGTIPKRFTKAWWSYFWDYYKWHTIATAFVLALVAITVKQCIDTVKYDTTITFAGDIYIPTDKEQVLADKLSEIIDDCDDNGERNVYLQKLVVSDGMEDMEYSMAMSTKLTLEFAAGEGYVFIFDKATLDSYLNGEGYEMFIPVAEWADELPDKSRLSLAKGEPYAVRLSDGKLLSEQGLDFGEYYILVRLQRNDEKEDAAGIIRYENAKKVANLLIK